MFFYPRFDDVFEDPFAMRRRRRRRGNFFDVDLFEDDPFTSFFDSSEDEDEYYQVPMLTMRRKKPKKKKKKVAVRKEKKKRDPMSLFFRDFGEGYPNWVNEFFGEKEEEKKEEKGIVIENKKEEKKVKEKKEEKKKEEKKIEPITYKRVKTFTSVDGKTESKEIVEDSRSGTKKEIHSKLLGDKMLTVIKKTTSEGKEEVLKKCENIENEEEFMKLWDKKETKAISEKKEQNQKENEEKK